MKIIKQRNNLRLVQSRGLYVIEGYLGLKNEWYMIASYYNKELADKKYTELSNTVN